MQLLAKIDIGLLPKGLGMLWTYSTSFRDTVFSGNTVIHVLHTDCYPFEHKGRSFRSGQQSGEPCKP